MAVSLRPFTPPPSLMALPLKNSLFFAASLTSSKKLVFEKGAVLLIYPEGFNPFFRLLKLRLEKYLIIIYEYQ